MQALMVGPAPPAHPHRSSVKDWEAPQAKSPSASPGGHGLQLTPVSCVQMLLEYGQGCYWAVVAPSGGC